MKVKIPMDGDPFFLVNVCFNPVGKRTVFESEGLITVRHQLFNGTMIDTWLFAALCLFFLALCAILRVIPGPTRFDRIIALNVAITIAVAGGLVLAVAVGKPVMIDIVIVITALCYAGTIGLARTAHGERT